MKSLAGPNLLVSRVIRQAENRFQLVRDAFNQGKPEGEQRHGGYLCLAAVKPIGLQFSPPIIQVRLGSPAAGKLVKYHALSIEKMDRLRRRSGDRSSWQSRDESRGQWGGAICLEDRDLIISFSGLNEAGDEAFALLLAIDCDLITPDEARKISVISSNNFFWALWQLIN